MGNRKQPFGYKIEFGAVVIEPLEAKVVQWIYKHYSQGDSYTVIVQSLKEQTVPYLTGKIWNKNMVARILEDKRYLGIQDYPVVIDKEIAAQVMEKREKKQDPKASKTDAQKLLRQLSGCKVTQQMEERVLNLLNALIARPEQIVVQPQQVSNAWIRELEQTLESLLEQMPVNKAEAKCLTMELAAERYAAIGNSGYETERMIRLLRKTGTMETLDAELLSHTVSRIRINGDGTICMQLKNGQGI